MARKKKEECPSVPGWLVSFGDLMSLLLTFFILLYSMSTISLEKFKASIRGITEAFGGRTLKSEKMIIKGKNVELNFPMYPKVKKIRAVSKKLNEVKDMLQKAGIEAEVISHGSTITLRLYSKNMYPLGSAYPYKNVIPYIMKLCEKLKETEIPLKIIGHTDNLPTKSKEFRNNLELSAARAVNILRLFIKCGYKPDIISAEGRGEFEPIAPNDTAKNRAKNRRVEFVLDVSA